MVSPFLSYVIFFLAVLFCCRLAATITDCDGLILGFLTEYSNFSFNLFWCTQVKSRSCKLACKKYSNFSCNR